jgi:hypothetical protein
MGAAMIGVGTTRLLTMCVFAGYRFNNSIAFRDALLMKHVPAGPDNKS